MCGFGGIIGDSSITRRKLALIAKCVSHRGPDFTGIKLYDHDYKSLHDNGCIGIFHNRLSIIDLEARSNQPFQDDKHILIFNGEIYNFEFLKKQLISSGCFFKTRSDTEVLFYCLKIFGKSIISKLNGMFAFAFIDKETKTLLLARDRVGIKPIYFSCDKNSFVFASEVDSIIRFKGITPSIDQTAVKLYELFQYIPDQKTIWKGIESISPGQLVLVHFENNSTVLNIIKEKYWDPYDLSEDLSSKKNLLELLNSSLQKQLVADVPIGVSLSSGVDSSLLTALLNKNFRNINPIYYSIAFKEDCLNDESKNAKKFLELIGVDSKFFRPLYVDSKNVIGDWKNIYKFVDQPFGDSAILLNWVVARSASKEVSVLISGDGADEVFFGYPRYIDFNDKKTSNGLTEFFASNLGSVFKHRGLLIKGQRNLLLKYLLMLDSSGSSANDIERAINSSDSLNSISIDIMNREDFPRLVDFKTYLTGMMFKVDRSTMAASVEGRVPYLDNAIIEYGLAQKNLVKNKSLKWELKEILSRIVPEFNFSLPKKGFSFPLLNWMASDWSRDLLEIINSETVKDFGMERKQLLCKYKSFQEGNMMLGHSLWAQLNLLQWAETKKIHLI